ncbi:MAG: DNA repair protein RecO [Clostridia bacterium]
MKLIKTTGIVIKETNYSDNDKIITLITKQLGKISCMVKGARKQNSPHLASSQFLVYSEFVLYEGKNFYHVNSSSVIDTFYNIRVDYDKLEIIFPLTKKLMTLVNEGQDCSQILRLFLNTLHFMKENIKEDKLLVAVFKIKLGAYLGYTPYLDKCATCYKDLATESTYTYTVKSHGYICSECYEKTSEEDKTYNIITMKDSVYLAVKYISYSKIDKLFAFSISKEAVDVLYVFADKYIRSIESI